MNFFQLGTSLDAIKQSKIPLLIGLLLTGLTTAITVIYIAFAQPVLPILYTLIQPEQTLVAKWWLLLLPFFSFLFSLINYLIHLILISIDRFILQLSAWFSVFIQIVLLMALFRIIFLTS